MATPSVQVTRRQRAAGISADLIAATMWGFTGIFVIYSRAAPLILTFYRLWISTLLMVVILLARRRRIPWKVLARTAPSGVLLCANLTCYVYAFKLTTIADASVIGALQPALVLVAAGFLFHEQAGAREVLLTAIAIAGVAGVVAGTRVSIGADARGDLFAVIGTLAFAGYWLFAKSARQQIPTFDFMTGVWVIAAIAITPLALASGESFTAIPAKSWPWIGALAIVPGTGHVLMNWGHRFVDASVSALIGILNAPVAAVAALLILQQPLSPFQVGCGLVAVAAIALVARGRPAGVSAATDPVEVPD
jgi:drug/metabolite transporter (DMT)-like permease